MYLAASVIVIEITMFTLFWRNTQGQTLAMRILAAKPPNSDLNFTGCFLFGGFFLPVFFVQYRPNGVLGKGVGNNKNASEMRQKCANMGLVLMGKEERSKCVRNASRMRQNAQNTFGGEHLLDDTDFFQVRKIRAPIKIKSALPPPPPKTPPKKGEFYGHGFSCRKNAFFPGVHKIGASIPAPELRTRILRTLKRFF